MKIALKELRETLIWLKIIERKPLCEPAKMNDIVKECDELIAIFVNSIKTAEDNLKRENQQCLMIVDSRQLSFVLPSSSFLHFLNQKSPIIKRYLNSDESQNHNRSRASHCSLIRVDIFDFLLQSSTEVLQNAFNSSF